LLPTRKRFWFAALIGLSLLFYTLKQADLKRLVENMGNIDPIWATMALLASALSYLCIAAVLHLLVRGIGHSLPFFSIFQISLLSCTLNYLMAIGGLSGVAAKVYLFSRERIPPSNTLSISMVHGFLTNTVAVIFIYLGFFFLYSEYKLSSREMELGIFILFVAFILTWITIQTMVHERFRKAFWNFSLRLGLAISRKLHRPNWIHRERAQAFFENFNDSMNLLVRKARILIAPASFALLDWTLMFVCLKCSFLAVHYPVDNRSLLVGFSVGIFTTIFSLTPASIGLMEGSMAGSFYLMGLDYEYALLATLIYRFTYFFLPIVVSVFFYKHFFPSVPARAKPKEDIEET
jgi:glycosyltransferase 2 family protein